MDALVSLIAEALGRFLPDRSAIASAREPLEKFLQSDRCHFLAVTVRGLKEGSPKVTVTTEPGPAQGCDLQLVLTAFNKQVRKESVLVQQKCPCFLCFDLQC